MADGDWASAITEEEGKLSNQVVMVLELLYKRKESIGKV